MTAAANPTTTHTVSFARNTRNGLWRAQCSCGWSWIGQQDEVQARAASHDIEWVDEKPNA